MKNIYNFILVAGCMFLVLQHTSAQDGFTFNCARDTVITSCSVSCITVESIVPNIHGSPNTSSYTVSKIAGAGVAANNCFRSYSDPGAPGPATNLPNFDDRYILSDIPFTFQFYGVNYNQLLISHNGYVTFDLSTYNGGTGFSHWTVTPGNLPKTGYDRAIIMGVYHDLYVPANTSPTQQTKKEVIGTAPHRKWVLTYYKIPLFSSGCNNLIQNTHQLVLHEGSGIIEVFVFDQQICTGWNNGKAMIGIQDYSRTKGMVAPGRGAEDPAWGSIGMNEAWRFTPADGPPLYRSAELVEIPSGTVIATGDTTNLGDGTFRLSFPNVCPSTTTSYIVRAKYENAVTPGTFFYSNDTVRVVRTAGILSPANVTDVACNGNTTGAITINASGASGGPFQYALNGGPYQSSNTFSNLAAGQYTISIQEVGGTCVKDTVITITQPSALSSSSTTTAATCTQVNGSITVTASGGTGALEYSINGGAFQSSNIFNVPNGAYTITIKDANGCITTTSATVALNEEIFLTGSAGPAVCAGLPVNLTAQSNATSYTWSPVTYLDNPTSATPVATPPASVQYTVTAVLGQCTRTLTIPVTIYQNTSVDAGQNVTITSGEQVQLNATVTNATIYQWTPSEGLSSTTILNPIAKPTVTTLYRLTVRNAEGCMSTDSILITVVPYCIKVKNAFTPNGDGINDLWTVYDQFDCMKNVTVHVYNRYGNKVFESRDYRNTWNGTYMGKPLPDGTYYAVVDFTLASGKKVTIKSDVSILR